ncbi:MAG: anthranilate synthase component I family protein, partial [Limisphaerales bacterium]
MRPLILEIQTAHTPESLVERLLNRQSNVVLLRSNSFDSPRARYSFVTANPFLTFRSFGSRCEITNCQLPTSNSQLHFGNPWRILDSLMARCELLDEIDLPFPLGGCFGFWGYDLKNFTEPKLPRRAIADLELPDCAVGFYDSLVVFDHQLGKNFIISTGLNADGSRSHTKANERLEFWRNVSGRDGVPPSLINSEKMGQRHAVPPKSNFSRADFISAVERAQKYIRAGDIYQVNLSQRLTAGLPRWGEGADEPLLENAPAREDAHPTKFSGWEFFQKLTAVSPAPFSAFFDCGSGSGHGPFQIVSSSPEQFLRMSGSHILTRPIKGTRPRDADATHDAQLAYELQTSAKELAELVMITDLLRNDLGKVCEFGSVQTPEIAKLEKF